MLIYYFELKKAAFWFNDFQQPSLGDIQMPLGICDLPSAGRPDFRRLCGFVSWRDTLFFSRKGAETQRNCLPLPSAAVERKIYFFSREGAKEKNNLAACLPQAGLAALRAYPLFKKLWVGSVLSRKGELKLKLEVFLYFSRPRLLISFRQALSQRFAASRAFFS